MPDHARTRRQAAASPGSAPRNRTLAPAMGVAMAMPVKAERGATEAAIGRGANFSEAPVRTARSIRNTPGTAVDPRHETHRYRAGGCGTHHGKDDTARTFHGITCLRGAEQIRAFTPKRPGSSSMRPAHSRAVIEADLRPTGKAARVQGRSCHSIVRDGGRQPRRQPPPEKCDENE